MDSEKPKFNLQNAKRFGLAAELRPKKRASFRPELSDATKDRIDLTKGVSWDRIDLRTKRIKARVEAAGSEAERLEIMRKYEKTIFRDRSNNPNSGRRRYTTQSERVIQKAGGTPSKLVQIIRRHVVPNFSYSTVRNWQCRPSASGIIAPASLVIVLEAFRLEGIYVTEKDLDPRPRLEETADLGWFSDD